MAKRLNKQVVLGLTVAGMVLTTAVCIVLVVSLPKRDPQPLIDKAEKLIRDKEATPKGPTVDDYEQAAKLYYQASVRARTRNKPDLANTCLVEKGKMSLAAGNAIDARVSWERVLSNNNRHEAAQECVVKLDLELATLFGGRMWAELLTSAEKLKDINPDNPVGLHALGVAQINQRSKDDSYAEEGEKNLIAGLERDPSEPEYANSLGRFYFTESEFDKAQEVYDTLIENNPPQDPELLAKAYLYRGQFYLQKKMHLTQLARAAGGASGASPAEAKRIAETDERARLDLEQAFKLSPRDEDVLIGLGQYWQLKESIATDDVTQEKDLAGYLAEAKKYYKMLAEDVNPDNYDAYRSLAQLHAINGELEEALKVVQERMNRGYNRDHYLAQSGLDAYYMTTLREDAFKINLARLELVESKAGNTEREREQIMAGLRDLYNQTVAETPGGEDDPRALFMKGRLLVQEDDLLGASRVLEEAISLSENLRLSLEIKQMLADVYLRTNRPGPAKTILNEMLTGVRPNESLLSMLAYAHMLSFDAQHPEELDKARQAAEAALAINKNNRQALFVMRKVYQEQGNEEGFKRVDAILSAGIGPLDQKVNQAFELVQSGEAADVSRAEAMFREVLTEDPTHLRAVWNLLVILQKAPERASELKGVLDQTKTAFQSKLDGLAAQTDASGEEKDRLKQSLDRIRQWEAGLDPNASDEEKTQRLEKLIKEGSDDKYTVAMELANLYRQFGRFEDVLAQLKTAHALKPDERGVIQQLFQLALRQGLWQLAEELIPKAARTGLDPSGGHFYRGQLLLTQSLENPEQAEKARAEIQTGISVFPNDPTGHVLMGDVLLRLQQYANASRAFERARQMNPRHAAAVVGLAMASENLGDEAEFERRFASCEELAPYHPWVIAKRTQMEYQRDPKKGIVELEAKRKQAPEDVDNLLLLADLYGRAGQPDDAVAIFKECRKFAPESLRVVSEQVRFLREKDPPEPEAAEAVLREMVDSTDAKDGKRKAAVQLLLANHLLAVAHEGGDATTKEQWAEVEATHRAAATMSDAFEVRIDIGNYFRAQNELAEAEKWFREAIALASKTGSIDDQKTPRLLLIDTLLATRDTKRADDTRMEIAQYRERFPQDPESDLFEGLLNASCGDDVAGISFFEKFTSRAPDRPIGHYNTGLLHLRASRWDEAISSLRQAKRLDPSFRNYSPRIMLAEAMEESGQPDAAIAELQSILDEEPGLPTAVDNLLRIYAKLGRWSSSENLLKRLASENPENHLWPQLLARVATEQGNGPQAITFGEEAVKKSNFNPTLVKFLLATYLRFDRFDQLIDFVNKNIPADRQDAVVRLKVADAYAGKNEAERAINTYAEVFADESLDVEEFIQSVRQSIANRLMLDDAARAIKKRLADNPNEGISKLMMALVLWRQKDAQAHLQSLRDLVGETDPENHRMYLLAMRELALAAHNEARLEEARKTYEKILKTNPEDIVALNNLAYLLTENLKVPEEGLVYAMQAKKLAPDNPGVLDTLGWCLTLAGQYDEAIASLRRSVELSPKVAPVHYHAAEAFYRRGSAEGATTTDEDFKEARTEVQRAHKLLISESRDAERDLVLTRVIELGKNLGLELSEM